MPRATASAEVFNAVAEPQRRAILEPLAGEERRVGEVVKALRLAQPSVSKHLRVLRQVGLVRARREGRQMFYRTNAPALRPLHGDAHRKARAFAHEERGVAGGSAGLLLMGEEVI
jgi:DNA-binding transcriptional ArsR family regulator